MKTDAIVISKFAGLNNMMAEYVKDFSYMQEAKNIDIDRDYKIRSRKGYIKLINDSAHSLWSNNEICLYRHGTELKRLYPDNTAETLRSDLTSEKIQMHYLNILNKIYYSDGMVNGIIENGKSRSWGLIPPKSVVLSSVPQGSLKTGQYRVVATYVRGDEQESGSSLPVKITIADNMNINVFVESSNDQDVKNINVYVTEPDGQTFFLYQTVDNVTQNVTISSTLNLKRKLQTLFLKNPPVGILLTLWNSRIFIVVNNILYYTEPFAYELIHPSNYIVFEHPIQDIVALDNSLWVGTTNAMYCLGGNRPPFAIAKTIDYGVYYNTHKIISGSLLSDRLQELVGIWMTHKGICVIGSDGLFMNLTEKIYSFPQAIEGHSLFREYDGMYKYIIWMKEPKIALNDYKPIGNKIIGYLPEFTINAEAS